MEFEVSVDINFTLYKVIEAENEEEAKKIAENLEPDQFDNFHEFYEWLGFEWKRVIKKVEVEKL